MLRKAWAEWKGGLKDGKGVVSTDSGAVKGVAYNFGMRFENTPGTNPEELIAAAHASCYSMALSAELGKLNVTPDSIRTTANLSFDKVEAGWSVTGIHLETHVRASKADAGVLDKAAKAAKEGCPISRLLAPGTKITLDAKLEK